MVTEEIDMQYARYFVLASAFAVACADSPTSHSGTIIGGFPPPLRESHAALKNAVDGSHVGSDHREWDRC